MTSNSDHRQTVKIMGELLPVKTRQNDKESSEAVALVREKIRSIQEQSSDANRLQVALLTCLNLAGQLTTSNDQKTETSLNKNTINRLEELEQRLNSIMNGEQS